MFSPCLSSCSSVLMSVPCRACRMLPRCPCGKVHSRIPVPTWTRRRGGRVHFRAKKYNSWQGGQVHYIDAAAGNQMIAVKFCVS